MFGMGPWELGIIAIVLVLLFGSQLPKVARSAGQSLMEFKRGFKEIELECREMDNDVTAKVAAAKKDVEHAVKS